MNRLIKSLLIAMCLMGVLSAGCGLFAYYYVFRGGQEREEAETAERKILQLTQDEIREVTLTRDDGSVVRAIKRDDDWRLQEPLEAAGDNSNWNSMTRSLADAKRNWRIPMEEIAGAGLGAFGLATPEIQVAVAGIDRASQELLSLGIKSPLRQRSGASPSDGPHVGPQVYARLGDADEIVSLDESVKNAVDKKLFDLRDKRIVSFQSDEVHRVEVEAGDSSYRLDRIDEDRWQISQPVEAQANGSEITSLVNRIRNARIKQFIDETPSSYASYGLSKPATRVVFWAGEEDAAASWSSQAVLLGSTSEVTPANAYAKRDNQDNVFAVEVSTFKVPASIDELRLREITALDSWDVKRMSVAVAGEKVVEVSKDAGNWIQVFPKEGECTWSSVNDLVRKAADLEIAEFVGPASDEAELGLEENDVVIELSGDDAEDRIALSEVRGGTDGLRFGVRQPPRELYSVKSADVQELLDLAGKVELQEQEEDETAAGNEEE